MHRLQKTINNVTGVISSVIYVNVQFLPFEIAQALNGTLLLHLTMSCIFDNDRGGPFHNKRAFLTHGVDGSMVLLTQQGGQE